jgi:hypothetical protein
MRGQYAKPPGFKSRAEMAVEAELKEARRLAELRQQALDCEFGNMIEDPDNELYQKCLERLKPIERRRQNSIAFRAAMQKRFLEI